MRPFVLERHVECMAPDPDDLWTPLRRPHAASNEGRSATIYHYQDGYAVFSGKKVRPERIVLRPRSPVIFCEDCGKCEDAKRIKVIDHYDFDGAKRLKDAEMLMPFVKCLCPSCAGKEIYRQTQQKIINQNAKIIKDIRNAARKANQSYRHGRPASPLSC